MRLGPFCSIVKCYLHLINHHFTVDSNYGQTTIICKATRTYSSAIKDFDDTDHGLSRSHDVDTSLLMYFFGKRGDGHLGFDDFSKFMDNLQTEVLQMEYNEFSKGTATITELDFARILLRYTFLNSEEYQMILDQLVDRLNEDLNSNENHELKGITFEEFKDFCLFLNNLDDFQVCK